MSAQPDKNSEPTPNRPDSQREGEATEERHLGTAELMIGVVMMFLGFLDVLVSISTGSEMGGVLPIVLYFAGLAIWAHAAVRNLTVRYVIIAASIVLALAFHQYGEVLFWHKQVVFWTTIALVGFFMFKGSKPSNP
jgi:hypothetical protein